jgi:hypothetical protein
VSDIEFGTSKIVKLAANADGTGLERHQYGASEVYVAEQQGEDVAGQVSAHQGVSWHRELPVCFLATGQKLCIANTA